MLLTEATPYTIISHTRICAMYYALCCASSTAYVSSYTHTACATYTNTTHTYTYIYTIMSHMWICAMYIHCVVPPPSMGWLWLVGSINYRSLLQKSPTKEPIFCKRDL